MDEWEVTMEHDDCKFCEAAVDSAVGLAKQERAKAGFWTEREKKTVGTTVYYTNHTAWATAL